MERDCQGAWRSRVPPPKNLGRGGDRSRDPEAVLCGDMNRAGITPSQTLSLHASVCVSVCLSVCQSLACPRDNSGPVQARITKFGPKMQKTLVKVHIVLWTDRPWPSRSNLTWKSKFTPFWACLHHNSPPIQAGINKFGPEVQNILVEVPIVLGGNWPWPSKSNMT